jgi:transposase
MAFFGPLPSEHSSGEHRRKGSTKVGNSHVRRPLVEAAWHVRRRSKVGYEFARRHRGQARRRVASLCTRDQVVLAALREQSTGCGPIFEPPDTPARARSRSPPTTR